MHDDPHNCALQGRIGEASDLLGKFEQHLVEGQRVRSRVKWKWVGDSCSKYFFRASKAYTGASNLTELEDEHGVLQSDQAALEDVCSNYYGKLYKDSPCSAAKEGASAQALVCLGDRLSQAMKQSLRRPISQDELGLALKGMDFGKSSKLDGVIIEFFKSY